MSFRAAAQGGPVMARRAALQDLRERQEPAGQGQGQQSGGQTQQAASGGGGQTPQAGGQAQQSGGAQSGGQAQGSPQGQQPAAASTPAAANQASGQAGQSPGAAAASGSPASSPAAQSPAASAQAAPAASPSGAQNAAQSEAAQGGTPGGPTNIPPGSDASGSADAPATPTSFYAPNWSTDPGAFISSTVEHSSKGLSQPAIGALVGGIIGGLALIIVVFVIWRQCRGRGEKVAPPPPREVSYRPPTTVGNPRRSMSMTMSSNHRVSSNSTLLQTRASGTFRQSYYSAYPVDSPTSSIQQDQSPRFPSNSIPSGSPSLTSSGGNTTPHCDGSTGSAPSSGNEASAFQEHDGRPLRRIGNSADQLSPYDNIASTDGSDSRTTGSDSRTSSPPPSIAGRLPRRNPSVGSLGGGLRFGGHQRGAPHHRSISIALPRPLSETSVNALDSNPVSPTGTYNARNGYPSSRTTPHSSTYGEFGAQPTQASPSGHGRGPSTSSRASDNRPDAAQVDNLRFEGREDIV